MGRTTENSNERIGYGRNTNLATAALSGITMTCSSEKTGTCVIRGNGQLNSTGVTPDGSSCSLINAQTEVEFNIDVYKKGNNYQGELYIVSYDTRKKINSNKLIYYQQIGNEEAICIFCVYYHVGCTVCSYELVVSMSPTDCQVGSLGSFYGYAAPICNEGVNIGGTLTSGEIIFYEQAGCKGSCNCTPCNGAECI